MIRQFTVSVKKAQRLLKSGEVVAIPTETVYGLAGKASCPEAVKKIFQVKKRPHFDPLILHVHSINKAFEFLSVGKLEKKALQVLMKKFWPGPLTLVARSSGKADSIINAGLECVAVRYPRHKLVSSLLESVGPLVAPSANLFGKVSPTKAQHVLEEFQNNIPVLDGGECSQGLESTIIQIIEKNQKIYMALLRHGHISFKELGKTLQSENIDFEIFNSEVIAPGKMKDHYQPYKPLVILEGKTWDKSLEEIVKRKLGVKAQIRKKAVPLGKDPYEVARTLYSDLRDLSGEEFDIFVVERLPFQEGELWDTIWSRLRKASLKF